MWTANSQVRCATKCRRPGSIGCCATGSKSCACADASYSICSLHQVSPNSWRSFHIGWCIPARWLERICCDLQQESVFIGVLRLHWLDGEDLSFVRYTEIPSLEISAEEMWNTMCNKAGNNQQKPKENSAR